MPRWDWLKLTEWIARKINTQEMAVWNQQQQKKTLAHLTHYLLGRRATIDWVCVECGKKRLLISLFYYIYIFFFPFFFSSAFYSTHEYVRMYGVGTWSVSVLDAASCQRSSVVCVYVWCNTRTHMLYIHHYWPIMELKSAERKRCAHSR